MPIQHVTPSQAYPRFSSLVFPTIAPVTVSTAGAVTYTAAQILSGLILRDPNGASRSDVFPSAASIVAAIPGCQVNSSFRFGIRNTADAFETITMTAGTGGTVSGTATIAQNTSREWTAVVTNITSGSEAVTFYSAGSAMLQWSQSGEQTGTGSSQNVAHGLGVTPTIALAIPTDTSPSTAGVFVVTYGSHTSTNVVLTVTSGKKFMVLAGGLL